jgi:hypothetical protein
VGRLGLRLPVTFLVFYSLRMTRAAFYVSQLSEISMAKTSGSAAFDQLDFV